MDEMPDPLLGWHFAPEARRLGYGDGGKIEAGYIYSVEGPLVMCKWGLHGSVRAIDALRWAPGPIVSRVEFTGERIVDNDKLVSRNREHLWIADATDVLHEFACRCAEQALALVDTPDPRSVDAIRVKRAWMRGEATDEELAAAWDAARDAARAAAGDAASAAARDAARDAAWAAAWDAARDAAWAAASTAASAAARDAARDAQNVLLTEMLMDLADG